MNQNVATQAPTQAPVLCLTPIINLSRLERIARFVREHGQIATIDGGAVMIQSVAIHRDGREEIIVDQADTMEEAREILGY